MATVAYLSDDDHIEKNAARLIKKFDSLAKRAAKYGLTPPVLHVTGWNGSQWALSVSGGTLAPHGEWSYDGHINIKSGAVSLHGNVPGHMLDYTAGDPFMCDHCNKVRNRNMLVFVRNAKGEVKQVGRQCLQEYTGIDPDAILNASRMSGDFQALRDGCGWEYQIPTDKFLAACIAEVRENGWTSGQGGVADVVWLGDVSSQFTAEDLALAKDMIAFHRAECPYTDFGIKLRHALVAPVVVDRTKRIAACAARRLGVEEKAKAADILPTEVQPSTWFGEIGQKFDKEHAMHVEVVFKGGYTERNFGHWVHIVKVRNDKGQILTWFTSTQAGNVDVGSQWYITGGKIKEHTEYRGELQTTVKGMKLAAKLLDTKK